MRTKVVSLTLLLAITLGIVIFVFRDCVTNTAFDSRWNYRRAGSFFPSTPSISADGSLIVFDSARSGKGDLFKAYRGTNDALPLIPSPAMENQPVLSKEGAGVIFRIPASERDGPGGAYVISLDAGEVKRLDQVPSEPLP